MKKSGRSILETMAEVKKPRSGRASPLDAEPWVTWILEAAREYAKGEQPFAWTHFLRVLSCHGEKNGLAIPVKSWESIRTVLASHEPKLAARLEELAR